MGGSVKTINKTPEEKQLEQELEKDANFTWLWVSVGIFLGFVIGVPFVFIFAHPWNFTCSADSAQWGQYGDFIGGLLGTAIALLSVYYLIKTLRKQIAANLAASNNNLVISNVNYLQQTDTKICHLIEFYKEVRESYKEKTPKHKTLNEEVVSLKNKLIKSEDNYINRLIAAKEVFDKEFYIPCKPVAAVQFRVLYQIMCLIETIDQKKNNDIKLFYGKMVRSQLSEDELLLLRYNCQCKYGAAMREHICRFNLLKHLPPLSLLEFQYWSKNVLSDEVLQNAVDTELIAERKEIIKRTSSAYQKPKDNKPIQISDKYHLYLDFRNDRKEFTYKLTRRNGLPDIEHIDEALSKLGDNHTMNFIKDFLHEVFEYSNFQKYNKELEYLPLHSQPEYDADKQETIFKVVLRNTSDTKIVMNYDDYLTKGPIRENMPIEMVGLESEK